MANLPSLRVMGNVVNASRDKDVMTSNYVLKFVNNIGMWKKYQPRGHFSSCVVKTSGLGQHFQEIVE